MAEPAVKSLGKIEGLCACYTKTTLNGRGYDQIYKRLLAGEDYRYNEMMRRGGILCELSHPSQFVSDFERTETDIGEACVLIQKIEEREHGKLYAEGIILDTPKGRIFNAIRPFYKFGFSSRGSYEADENSLEGPDGWNQDSYVFKGFDIVALPANEGSEISATESLGSKKRPKFKSAREALDLQNIADAANVDPKEVEAELDKLFTEDGTIAPAELVDARKFLDNDGVNQSENATDIHLDLQKALTDKTNLEREVQRLLFEKSNSDAATVSLQAQITDLTKQLETAQSQLQFYIKNKQEIEELINKLISTHEGAMAQADSQLAQEQEKSKSLASQVAELSQKVTDATDEASTLFDQASKAKQVTEQLKGVTEQLKKANAQIATLRTSNESLTKQLATANEAIKTAQAAATEANKKSAAYNKIAVSAREALVNTYSSIYSIDPKALMQKIGRSGDVALIKRAAESLSNDVLRFSAYSTPVAPQSATESARTVSQFPIRDEIDRELFDGLKKDNKVT